MAHTDSIDRLKGFLIVLVVAGHVFGGAAHLCVGMSQILSEWLYKVIYLFHMPAFFWLAGMCWRTKEESFGAFAVKKARRLLVPYMVFGILSAAVYLVTMSGGALFSSATTGHYQNMGINAWWQPFMSLLHGGGWPNGEGFRCNSVLWFLPAMFSVTCFYWIVNRQFGQCSLQLCLAAVLLAFEFVNRRFGFLSALPLGIAYIPWYGSFLILGRWIRLERVTVPAWGVLIGWVIFGLLAWMEPNSYFGYTHVTWYVVFVLMAVLGIALSIWTSHWLKARWLVSCGTASLGIMLFHKFVILALQVKLPFVAHWAKCAPFFWMANLFVILASVVISLGATKVIRHFAPWTLGKRGK